MICNTASQKPGSSTVMPLLFPPALRALGPVSSGRPKSLPFAAKNGKGKTRYMLS